MKHPLLYQVNTRCLLQELGAARSPARPGSLDDIPESFLDELAGRGFEWVWFLGVWQTGEFGRKVSRTQPEILAGCRASLPDLKEEDICGSPFAIQAYRVNRDFGGDAALARLRKRMQSRGLKLLLDFVPNHLAVDHPWVQSHPEYFVQGTEADLAREPRNYIRVPIGTGERILAHGRDPYFPGWPDTLQLNYRHAGARQAMLGELARVAEQCDGVRCDMAMLLLPEVFQRTWGDRARPSDGTPPVDAPFWPPAIAEVRRARPGFVFIAEVYWDLEWELQRAGFDFTYDKRLYDRLRGGAPRAVREHLLAQPDFQNRSARFLENHDEPRAAAAFGANHAAAAAITYLVPGLRFFHDGQFDGRTIPLSMHVGRRTSEPMNAGLHAFYDRLLEVLKRPETHDGEWRLWNCRPAWEGNGTWEQFVICSWESGDRRLLVAVNYGPSPAQGYVTLGLRGLAGNRFTLVDLLGDARYERDGDALAGNGLYLDLAAWQAQVFELRPATGT